jgi:hypothetical protein
MSNILCSKCKHMYTVPSREFYNSFMCSPPMAPTACSFYSEKRRIYVCSELNRRNDCEYFEQKKSFTEIILDNLEKILRIK